MAGELIVHRRGFNLRIAKLLVKDGETYLGRASLRPHDAAELKLEKFLRSTHGNKDGCLAI